MNFFLVLFSFGVAQTFTNDWFLQAVIGVLVLLISLAVVTLLDNNRNGCRTAEIRITKNNLYCEISNCKVLKNYATNTVGEYPITRDIIVWKKNNWYAIKSGTLTSWHKNLDEVGEVLEINTQGGITKESFKTYWNEEAT